MHGRSAQDISGHLEHLMLLNVNVCYTFESMPFISHVERILFLNTEHSIFKRAENCVCQTIHHKHTFLNIKETYKYHISDFLFDISFIWKAPVHPPIQNTLKTYAHKAHNIRNLQQNIFLSSLFEWKQIAVLYGSLYTSQSNSNQHLVPEALL